MTCENCGYWYAEKPTELSFCHYPYDDGEAPCEIEDRDMETEDTDEEPFDDDEEMNTYTVFISDSAVYENIIAASEEEAEEMALNWFEERKPKVKVVRTDNTSESNAVYLIHEDNHGLLGAADSWESAIDFLISTDWINGCCEWWIPEEQRGVDLEDFFDDWRDWLRNIATASDLENLGFKIKESQVYKKGD